VPSTPKVTLKLDDGSDYPLPGTLQFSEVTVDASTGTVALRAKFPNPDGLLLPGLFARVRLSQAAQAKVFLVPQTALSRDPRGNATVFVLGAGNKAQLRKVTADRTMGDQWVVSAGLKAGDKVITQGLGKIKPDAVVRPVPDNTPEKPMSPKKPAGQ
jgi:membrane fusion protein (multidrug efflux system)